MLAPALILLAGFVFVPEAALVVGLAPRLSALTSRDWTFVGLGQLQASRLRPVSGPPAAQQPDHRGRLGGPSGCMGTVLEAILDGGTRRRAR
jgi:hypothetical protein